MFKAIKSRWSSLVLASALAALPAFAEGVSDAPVTMPVPAEEPQVMPSPEAAKAGTPAIWTVKKPNGGTITLFGSVHLLPAGLDWHTPALTAALDGAETVAFETPIAGMTAAENMAYLQSQIMNPPGVMLSSLLNSADKEIVEKAAKSVGVSLGMLEAMRPWFVAAQMGVLYAVNQGFDPNSGVDPKVEAEAKEKGKTLDYFETAREQIDLFAKLGQAQETRLLVMTAQDLLEKPDELKAMVDAWYKGDTVSMNDSINGSLDDTPEIAATMLYDRNARWVDKIAGTYMADSNDYLIVVGAGHLIGDKGVPALLRARGIAVEGP